MNIQNPCLRNVRLNVWVWHAWILTSDVSKQMEAEKPSYAVYGNVCACGRLPDGREEREAPVSISAHPRQCPPHPLPHNLTNIKSRHGTKTPPISSAVRAPLSLPCNFLHLSLSLVPVEGFWHVGSSSTVIDWHWLAHIGSSHVMLLTATPHMPLGRSPYIGTGRQLKLRFVCRTQRQPRTKDCLLPLIYAKWGRTEFNFLDRDSWARQLRMPGNFREAKLSPQTILVPVGWAAEYSGGGEHTPLEDGLSGLPPLQSIDDPAVWLPVAHLCVAVCSCV